MSLVSSIAKRNPIIFGIALFLAIAPILDPYVLLQISEGITIKFNDLFVVVLGLFCFLKKPIINLKTAFLCKWVVGLSIISIIANIISDTSVLSSMKNALIWMVYAFLLMNLWTRPCRNVFFEIVEFVSFILSIYIVIQFVCGYAGIPMWDGKLPFLSLGKYDDWAGYIDPHTGGIRPNGFFQESSYAGIYLSLSYIYSLNKGGNSKYILFILAMIATTSMVSVALLIFSTIIILFSKYHKQLRVKKLIYILGVFGVLFITFMLLYHYNEAVNNSLNYLFHRVQNINSDINGSRMGSTKYRLIGHLDLYNYYSIPQKIFGVGIAQYSNYFGVLSYSNVLVTTLLNSGLLGLLYLFVSLVSFALNLKKDRVIYLIIFIVVLSVDYQWFSWLFFYLLSACVLNDDLVYLSYRRKCYGKDISNNSGL